MLNYQKNTKMKGTLYVIKF